MIVTSSSFLVTWQLPSPVSVLIQYSVAQAIWMPVTLCSYRAIESEALALYEL